MRRAVILAFVLAVLAGIVSIADIVIRQGVQNSLADRIEAFSPGSDATVKISSFPFLGHLAVSGTVPSMRADVTNVASGNLTFAHIDLTVSDLKLSRTELFKGQVRTLSIGSGQVAATITQPALDAFTHLSVTLGHDTVRIDGSTVKVHISTVGGVLVIQPGNKLPVLRVPVPALDVMPCVGSARLVPGAVLLSCRFTTVPGLLEGTFRL